MKFAEMISAKRKSLNLGVRELCKKANSLPGISETISQGYYSQIELESVAASRISVDKIWTISAALALNPLYLFAMSRDIERIPSFSIRSTTKADFSDFITSTRNKMGLGLREAAREISKHIFKMSSPYLSQLENNENNLGERISGEKLWSIGCAYDVDPLLLFVLSRKIEKKYLQSISDPKDANAVKIVIEFDDFQDSTAIEGHKYETEILMSSRNRKVVENRKLRDGHSCQVCGFKLNYHGKALIECHHLQPISEGKRTTAMKDLICLCPTCHRIAHLQNPPLAPEDIKSLLASQNL